MALDPLHSVIGPGKKLERSSVPEILKRGSKSVEVAQGVSVALDKQHGTSNRWPMRSAKLIRLPRRMKRIGEEDEPVRIETIGDEHRTRASAHRSAAENQPRGLRAQSPDSLERRPLVFEKTRHPVGRATSETAVGKPSAGDVRASARKSARGRHKASLVDVAPSAVPKDHERIAKRSATTTPRDF